jgi:pyridoxal phosphate enzyme (YggS family)
MTVEQIVAANLASVRQRIEAACARVGRDPTSVTLVAVTKAARSEWVRSLVALGTVELGESRPQQLASRSRDLTTAVHWHLIGPLQRNKVRLVLPVVSLIHSVDSLRLLESINRIASELALRPRLLIEVNLSGEPAKHGFSPAGLRDAWPRVQSFDRVSIEGLMTMAAYSENPEDARPAFAALRTVRDELAEQDPARRRLPHLSMGMSGDFERAIEEGATLVRIGSALWEGLPTAKMPNVE